MNGEPLPRTSPLAAAVAAVAATAVGATFAVMNVYPAIAGARVDQPEADHIRLILLGTLIAAVGAAVLAVPLRHRFGGWPLAGAGLAALMAVAALTSSISGPEAVLLYWAALSATGGLALLGTLNAAAGSVHRLAIGAGLAAGLAGSRLLWHLMNLAYAQVDLPPTAAELMVPGATLLLVIVAALTDPPGRPVRPEQPERPAGTGGLLAVVGAAVFLLAAGSVTLRVLYEALRVSADGLASLRRMEFVQDLTYFGPLVLALLLATLLTWYAARRGGADLARWTVLAFAAAAPLGYLQIGVRGDGELIDQLPAALAAVAGAAAGTLLVRRADRWFAWETIGLALSAVGVLAGLVAYRQTPTWWTMSGLLLAGGLGLALGAGVVRVLGTAEGGPVRTAGSVGLGFATLLLAAQALGPVVWRAQQSDGYGEIPLTIPVLTGVLAIVLLVLFGVGRTMRRLRADLLEQARVAAAAEPAAPAAN
ncbi:hypothetical protein QEZ54_14015 [Catellatospora sp. KI3]|uniref:hypothetical protein n=1 Tax=Catellatospora sp. KI3 TaxID=3041620 RepID=UPI0024829AC3|nr:hypothetical protein [Catellatospora sp. KI3]MDI1462086.1 hypothetical protein [Catellatospora sp. KI3]